MVPNDDLLFNVEINTKRGKRNVEDLNEALANNTEQAKRIQAELRRLEKEYKSIATAMLKLPKNQLDGMSKEVEKAEVATKELSVQMEKTAEKMDRVADRASYTEEAVGGLAVALAGVGAWFARFKILGAIASIATFANQIMHATQAIKSFLENVGPFLEKTRNLLVNGFDRIITSGQYMVRVFKILGGAIREQIQLFNGYHVVLVRTGQVMSGQLLHTFKIAVSLLSSGSSRIERAMRGILQFVSNTSTGITRVTKVFREMAAAAVSVGKTIEAFARGLTNTFGKDTAGAARINPWTKLFLNIQLEISAALVSLKSFSTAVSTVVSESSRVLVKAVTYSAYRMVGFTQTITFLVAALTPLGLVLQYALGPLASLGMYFNALNKSITLTTSTAKSVTKGVYSVVRALDEVVGPLRFAYGMFTMIVAPAQQFNKTLEKAAKNFGTFAGASARLGTGLGLLRKLLNSVFLDIGLVMIGFIPFATIVDLISAVATNFDNLISEMKTLKSFVVFLGGQIIQVFVNMGQLIARVTSSMVTAMLSVTKVLKRSTVGAAQVGVFRQIFLEVAFALEQVGEAATKTMGSVVKFGKTISDIFRFASSSSAFTSVSLVISDIGKKSKVVSASVVKDFALIAMQFAKTFPALKILKSAFFNFDLLLSGLLITLGIVSAVFAKFTGLISLHVIASTALVGGVFVFASAIIRIAEVAKKATFVMSNLAASLIVGRAKAEDVSKTFLKYQKAMRLVIETGYILRITHLLLGGSVFLLGKQMIQSENAAISLSGSLLYLGSIAYLLSSAFDAASTYGALLAKKLPQIKNLASELAATGRQLYDILGVVLPMGAIHFSAQLKHLARNISLTFRAFAEGPSIFQRFAAGVQSASEAFVDIFIVRKKSVGAAASGPWKQLALEIVWLFESMKSKIASAFLKLPELLAVARSGVIAFINTTLILGSVGIGTALGKIYSGFISVAAGAKNVFIAIDQLALKGFNSFVNGAKAAVNATIAWGSSTGFLSKGIFGVLEAGNLFGATALLLGMRMKESENAFISVTGSVLEFASVISLGFSTAVTIALGVVGNFIDAIGTKLINMVAGWEEKFKEAQDMVTMFKFTIEGFAKTFGTDVVGSFDTWNGVVREMTQTTTFGFKEIQKSIKLLITEGQALGFSFSDNMKALKASADLAAVTGTKLEDVTLSVVRALGGMGSSLQSLGVFTTNAALAHSNLVAQQNINIETLNTHEKAQLVLNSILEQTAPIAGAAAEGLSTLTGASTQLTRSLEEAQSKLGVKTSLLAELIRKVNSLVQAFNALSPEFFNFVSTMLDTLGVTLKVVGVLTTLSVTIIGLVSIYSLLNGFISGNVFLSTALTIAFGALGKAVGVNVGAVQSLNAVLLTSIKLVIPTILTSINLLIKLAFGAAASLRGFVVSLLFTKAGWIAMTTGAVAATQAVTAFTLAIVTNPIFIKGALLVAALIAVTQAISDLRKEMSALTQDVALAGDEVGVFSEAFSAVKDTLKASADILVRFVKISLAGLLKMLTLLQASTKLWDLLKNKITGNVDGFEKVSDEVAQLAARMETLDTVIDNALGADKVEKVELFYGAVKKAAESVKGFSNSLRLSEEVADGLKIDVLGDEFDRANKKFSEANKLLNNIRDQGVIKVGAEILMPTTENLAKFVSGALDTKDAKAFIAPDTKELEKAAIEAEKSRLELLKLRKDGLKEVAKLQESTTLRNLEASGKEIEAIKMRGAQELANFRESIARNRTIGEFTSEEIKLIKRVEEGIKKATQAELDRKKASLDEDTAKKLKEQADNLDKIKNELLSLQKESLEYSKDFVGVARIENAIDLMKLDTLKRSVMTQKEFLNDAGELKDEYAAIFDEAENIANVKLNDVIDENKLLAKFTKALESVDVTTAGGTFAVAMVSGVSKSIHKLSGIMEDMEIGNIESWREAIADAFDSLDPSELMAGATAFAADSFSGALSSIGDMISPDTVTALTDTFDNFADIPDMLLTAFKKFDGILTSFIKAFPSAIERVVAALPGIFASVVDKLPELAGVLLDGLSRIIDILPTLVNKLLSKLPDILQEILSRLPDLITKIFAALGDVFASVVKNLPSILTKIMEHIPDIVEAMIVGFADGMDRVALALVDFLVGGGLEKIVVALVKMMPRLAIAIANGFIRAVTNSFKSLLFGLRAPEELINLPAKFQEGLNSLAKTATEESSKLFRVLDLEQAARGLDKAQAIEDALDRGIDKFNDRFVGLVKMLLDAWNTIKEGIYLLMGGWLIELNKALFEMALQLLDFGKKIWEGLVVAIQGAWSFIQEIGAKIWSGLVAMATQAADVFGQWGTLIWNALWNGLNSSLDFFTNLGARIWHGLKAGLDTLEGFFNNLFNTLNPSSLLSKLFSVPSDAWGKGAVEKTLGIDIPFMKFASGGHVPGRASVPGDSEMNDRILALMSPGEAVIPRSKMAVPWIADIVDAILSGKLKAPGFAMGGYLGSLASQGGDFLSSLSGPVKQMFSSLGGAGEAIYKSIAGSSFEGLIAAVSGGLDLKNANPGDLLSAMGSLADTQRVLSILGKTISGTSSKVIEDVWNKVQKSGKYGSDLLKAVPSGDLWKLAKEHAYAAVLRTFDRNKFHSGGLIPSFAGGGEVPMMGLGGEFVLNRAATKSIGLGALNAMNRGTAQVGDQNMTFNIDIELNASGIPDEAFIRQRLIPTVKKELKEASLKGDFIISERGIRKS